MTTGAGSGEVRSSGTGRAGQALTVVFLSIFLSSGVRALHRLIAQGPNGEPGAAIGDAAFVCSTRRAAASLRPLSVFGGV